jgi:hypothetical protein
MVQAATKKGKVDWVQATVSGGISTAGGWVGQGVKGWATARVAGDVARRAGPFLGGVSPSTVGGAAGGTASGLMGEGVDVLTGKGFSPVDVGIGTVGGTVFSSTAGGFRVVEEMFPRSLRGHGKQLEIAVGKVLGGVWTKSAKALTP